MLDGRRLSARQRVPLLGLGRLRGREELRPRAVLSGAGLLHLRRQDDHGVRGHPSPDSVRRRMSVVVHAVLRAMYPLHSAPHGSAHHYRRVHHHGAGRPSSPLASAARRRPSLVLRGRQTREPAQRACSRRTPGRRGGPCGAVPFLRSALPTSAGVSICSSMTHRTSSSPAARGLAAIRSPPRLDVKRTYVALVKVATIRNVSWTTGTQYAARTIRSVRARRFPRTQVPCVRRSRTLTGFRSYACSAERRPKRGLTHAVTRTMRNHVVLGALLISAGFGCSSSADTVTPGLSPTPQHGAQTTGHLPPHATNRVDAVVVATTDRSAFAIAVDATNVYWATQWDVPTNQPSVLQCPKAA